MGSYKVLIVEDERLVAKDLQLSLTKIGYTVTGIASDIKQTLALLIEDKPDIVLMDIMLDNGDSGITAAEIIKKDYKLPVLFLTAYADPNTIEKAKNAEAYGYILKPFKLIDIQTNIELAIHKHGQDFKIEKDRDILYRIIENSDTNKKVIYIRSQNKLIRIKKDNILFIEALKDYVIIHLKGKKHIIHTTMKDIESKLGSLDFARIHRSYIVHLDKIESIEFPNITIEDHDQPLPIGGSYREDFLEKLNLI